MEAVDTGTASSARGEHVTLVLGGGWKLGCAFHAGVIMALRDVWGLDARRVDSLIGTSSGAVIGGLLAAGMSPEDLYCRETADELSAHGQEVLGRLGDEGRTGMPHGVAKTAEKLHRTLGLSARGAIAALLPRGRQSMAPLEQYFDDLVGPEWPADRDIRFCAVDLGTGQRVALGCDSQATVGQAIAASCCVPGISEPVVIQDREYVDGAIYSINNADVAAQLHDLGKAAEGSDVFHTVIVSAPLSVNALRLRLGPLGVLRNALHLQTAAEIRKLRGVDRLVVIEPSPTDVRAMGPDMNANRRRRRVASAARQSATAVLLKTHAPATADLAGANRS